jgi:hypothetical protein
MCVRYTFHHPDKAMETVAKTLMAMLPPRPEWATLRFNVTLSRYVNNSRHEGPGCLAAPEAEPPEWRLGEIDPIAEAR